MDTCGSLIGAVKSAMKALVWADMNCLHPPYFLGMPTKVNLNQPNTDIIFILDDIGVSYSRAAGSTTVNAAQFLGNKLFTFIRNSNRISIRMKKISHVEKMTISVRVKKKK